MLNKEHLEKFNQFYKSTSNGKSLNEREMLLVGLASAIALNCEPCTNYYLDLCEKNNISSSDIGDVLAKVMAISAGQKRIQFEKFTKNRKAPKENDHENRSCCEESTKVS